ncbi:MAG TPA: insulinase family protein, partial [Opitutales bacterium]|nr:insulinase family protein [Opitutales bacterium]
IYSRLFKSVREQRELSYAVLFMQKASCLYQPHGVWVALAIVEPKNVAAALDEMHAVVQKLLDDGISQDDFERTRSELLESEKSPANDPAMAFALATRYSADAAFVAAIPNRKHIYEQVTLEQVNAFLRGQLQGVKPTKAVVEAI